MGGKAHVNFFSQLRKNKTFPVVFFGDSVSRFGAFLIMASPKPPRKQFPGKSHKSQNNCTYRPTSLPLRFFPAASCFLTSYFLANCTGRQRLGCIYIYAKETESRERQVDLLRYTGPAYSADCQQPAGEVPPPEHRAIEKQPHQND
jgi:hypothetical protein